MTSALIDDRAPSRRPWLRSLTATASMLALQARAVAVSSSRPAMEALPDSSRRTSTRWRVLFACSLRIRTASGSSFISRAAALRPSWSTRSPGAAAARISSARAASSSDRNPVAAAIVSARPALMVPLAIPA